MDIKRAFTFFLEDESWIKKVGIGLLMIILSIFIIPSFALAGYSVAVGRKVMNGKELPLPEWNVGQNIKDGLLLSIGLFIYIVPVFFLMITGFILGSGLSVIQGESDIGVLLGGGVGFIFFLLAFVWLLVVSCASPALYIQYIREGTFKSMFNFSAITTIIRGHLKSILMVIAVMFAVNIGVSVIPGLGPIVAGSILLMIYGHLYGQIAAHVGAKHAKMAEF